MAGHVCSVAILATIYSKLAPPPLESTPKRALGVLLGTWLRVPKNIVTHK